MAGLKYQWMVIEWEEQQQENTRRVRRQLKGRMCPSRESVIAKLNAERRWKHGHDHGSQEVDRDDGEGSGS